jgi:excinuclease UvrABC nuclease subunit
VIGAEVVYIGKADNLRRRLREFARFGVSAPIGHWGAA